jgi:hypothetical protein
MSQEHVLFLSKHFFPRQTVIQRFSLVLRLSLHWYTHTNTHTYPLSHSLTGAHTLLWWLICSRLWIHYLLSASQSAPFFLMDCLLSTTTVNSLVHLCWNRKDALVAPLSVVLIPVVRRPSSRLRKNNPQHQPRNICRLKRIKAIVNAWKDPSCASLLIFGCHRQRRDPFSLPSVRSLALPSQLPRANTTLWSGACVYFGIILSDVF